ncbi:MAG TPA: hypothetical protein VFQ57_08250 [Sphingomonas sp.]|jgi:hypothetical protein|nr:hypothetical protein [Sphingomonas sp.]
MKTFVSLVILVLVPALTAMAPDQRRGDQRQAFEARRGGRLLPLPEIERRVVPGMRGAQYIGSDYDPDTAIYTLKFVRDGVVVWIEVDGQSGNVVGRSGR